MTGAWGDDGRDDLPEVEEREAPAKRIFYTDPLAAAWMAKHFGMKFADGEGRTASVWYDTDGVFVSWDSIIPIERAYIHPDSRPLLDPCVGDILRLYFYSPEEDDKHGAVMTGFYAGGREAITWFRAPKDGGIEKQLHKIDDHQWRIIQRQGTSFHWPESEGA
jgi:hypothetical protein